MVLTQLLAAFFRSPDADSKLDTVISVDVHQVVQRAQNGDGGAVATLYQIFAQPLYRYVVYRVPTTEDAEDILSEVFTRMVEGLPGYVLTNAPFESWLYRIAAARIADFYRRRKRRVESELDETFADDEPLPEEVLVEQQDFNFLRNAIRSLSEDQQTILILRFVERKSHEEVAVILNKSVTAVKSAQHRALAQLTELLGSNQKIRHYLRGRHE